MLHLLQHGFKLDLTKKKDHLHLSFHAVQASFLRHGRACPGHPMLTKPGFAPPNWMPGTNPGMTSGGEFAQHKIFSPPARREIEGMARRKAQTYGSAILLRIAAGASRRASCGRFRHRAPLSSKRPDRTPPPVASASSWQGLLVVPGGAPMPPECPACARQPAGTAPRPAVTTPHESAPQTDEVDVV